MQNREQLERWFIDEEGRIWQSTDTDLRRSLQTDISPEQLRGFMVGKMGFVEVRRRGPSLVVTLSPRKVSSLAVIGLLFWLHDAKWVGRLALQVFGSDHDAELLPNIATFAARLEVLCQLGWKDDRARFRNDKLSIAEMRADHSILSMFEWWRASDVRSRDEVAAYCDEHFQGRYTIVRPLNNGEFLVEAMGRGYFCYDLSYVTIATGTLLVDEPDHAYGMWITEAYRSVAISRAPDFSDITARIQQAQAAEVNVRYRRLVIPLNDPVLGQYLVSASILREAV